MTDYECNKGKFIKLTSTEVHTPGNILLSVDLIICVLPWEKGSKVLVSYRDKHPPATWHVQQTPEDVHYLLKTI